MDDSELEDLDPRMKEALAGDFLDDDDYEDIDENPLVVMPPLRDRADGMRVPDLEQIPQDRWRDVLKPCDPRERRLATETPPTPEGRMAALKLALELDGEDSVRRQQIGREAAPPPVPQITSAVTRRRNVRQVSFRLSIQEAAQLERVSYAYGTSSARLARMVTIRAVRRALSES